MEFPFMFLDSSDMAKTVAPVILQTAAGITFGLILLGAISPNLFQVIGPVHRESPSKAFRTTHGNRHSAVSVQSIPNRMSHSLTESAKCQNTLRHFLISGSPYSDGLSGSA